MSFKEDLATLEDGFINKDAANKDDPLYNRTFEEMTLARLELALSTIEKLEAEVLIPVVIDKMLKHAYKVGIKSVGITRKLTVGHVIQETTLNLEVKN